jgi:hypothetical protein
LLRNGRYEVQHEFCKKPVMTNICSIFALTAILFSSFALADDQPKASAKNPCSDDIQKYCSDVTPGEGRLAKCMKKHASELSSGCKEFGKKYKKEHPEISKELSNQKK